MEKINYEQIRTSVVTKVRFCTLTNKGRYVPNHWHRAIELVYLLEGELLVSVENNSRILHPGECMLYVNQC